MAIDVPVPTPLSIVKGEQRTSHIEILCPKGSDYVMIAQREVLWLDVNGNVIQRGLSPQVSRSVKGLMRELPFTCADGTLVTIGHMIEALSGYVDRFSEQDAQRTAAEAQAAGASGNVV